MTAPILDLSTVVSLIRRAQTGSDAKQLVALDASGCVCTAASRRSMTSASSTAHSAGAKLGCGAPAPRLAEQGLAHARIALEDRHRAAISRRRERMPTAHATGRAVEMQSRTRCFSARKASPMPTAVLWDDARMMPTPRK